MDKIWTYTTLDYQLKKQIIYNHHKTETSNSKIPLRPYVLLKSMSIKHPIPADKRCETKSFRQKEEIFSSIFRSTFLMHNYLHNKNTFQWNDENFPDFLWINYKLSSQRWDDVAAMKHWTKERFSLIVDLFKFRTEPKRTRGRKGERQGRKRAKENKKLCWNPFKIYSEIKQSWEANFPTFQGN